MGISISNRSGSSRARARIKRSRECSFHFPGSSHRTTQQHRAQSPSGALQEPEDNVGLEEANPQPLGALIPSLGLEMPHGEGGSGGTGTYKERLRKDRNVQGRAQEDRDTHGKFPHLLPQPRHIQQLPLPPNPSMGGTPIPGHPWKAARHHVPCSAPSSLAGPTYSCASTQPKICFVRGLGLVFFLF